MGDEGGAVTASFEYEDTLGESFDGLMPRETERYAEEEEQDGSTITNNHTRDFRHA